MTTQNVPNPFLLLPEEVKIQIFDHLSTADLTNNVALVCKDFLRVSSDATLWKKRTLNQYGENESILVFKQTGVWKSTYIALNKLKVSIPRKQKFDSALQRTLQVASSVFGHSVNTTQYYPVRSAQSSYGKITVYHTY